MSLDKMGGRKFLLTLIVIAVGSLVQMFGKNGVSEAFTALLVGVTATFGATNAFITHKSLSLSEAAGDGEADVSSPCAPQAAPPVDLGPIQQQLADAQAAISQLQGGIEGHSQALGTLQLATANTQKLVQALLPGNR